MDKTLRTVIAAEKIFLSFIVLLFICIFSQYCFAAEEKDGVTYYGNQDLPAEKPGATQQQQNVIKPNNSPADAVVAEVNESLCPKGNKVRYSDSEIQKRINRLEWLKITGWRRNKTH